MYTDVPCRPSRSTAASSGDMSSTAEGVLRSSDQDMNDSENYIELKKMQSSVPPGMLFSQTTSKDTSNRVQELIMSFEDILTLITVPFHQTRSINHNIRFK